MRRGALSAAILLLVSTAIVPAAREASALSPAPHGEAQRQRPRLADESRFVDTDDPGQQSEQGGEQSITVAPTDYAAAALRPPAAPTSRKMDTVLARLAQARSVGGDTASALLASQRGLAWRGGSVFVRVDAGMPIRGRRLRDASNRVVVEEVLADLNQSGARVRHVLGPHIEAWVPVNELAVLEARPSVRAIRRPWKMRSEARSEGAEVIGVDVWEGIRFRGPSEPLRVGVIDLGFDGWEGLRGAELPPADRVVTRSFRDDGDLEVDDPHGTAVAEVIYDIEPSVTLYLAAVDTLGEIDEAITYMIDNRIDVINMSLGCIGCGPGDGRGAAVELVERAPAAGIPFVTSAGNDATRHWLGAFVDGDGDGLHEFAPGDESNSFPGRLGDEVIITMNWDFAGWFASAEDLDLILVDSQGNVIDQSRNRQAGFPGQEASEEIDIVLPFDDTFHVVVQAIGTTGPQLFEIFVDHGGLEYIVPEQSLTVPADGRRVIAVGAALWSNDVPEIFSSRGPTKDGRMKPEMAAPDGVTTASFGPLGFFGTSAAAPHVVGAVALLRGRLGLLSGPDALQVLTPRLIDLAPTGADNISGGGRVSLLSPLR